MVPDREQEKQNITGLLTPTLPPGVDSTYTRSPPWVVLRLSRTLSKPFWARPGGFRALLSGRFLPEGRERLLGCLEASHTLSSFGLKCSESTYYRP